MPPHNRPDRTKIAFDDRAIAYAIATPSPPEKAGVRYATALLVIMNSARISGAVAFILLMGLTIWGGTLHFLENGTTIVGESLSPADRNEQVLLDGLADGRILYFKIEDYRINRIIY